MSLLEKNTPLATEALEDQSSGRGRLPTNGAGPANGNAADQRLWEHAFDEARARGAGTNVSRFYADQKLLYLRRNRDGIPIAGTGDFQAYR